MKIVKYICDKCGTEIEAGFAEDSNIHGLNFCVDCTVSLMEHIKEWAQNPIIEPEPAKEIEFPDEVRADEYTVEEPVKPKADKPKAEHKRQRIDWDKACALKLAGWRNEAIADELHANVGTINAMIYGKVVDYKRERGIK